MLCKSCAYAYCYNLHVIICIKCKYNSLRDLIYLCINLHCLIAKIREMVESYRITTQITEIADMAELMLLGIKG